MDITLEPVTAANEQAFRSLYNLYLHDLAQYQHDVGVDEQGCFDANVVDELKAHADQGVALSLIRSNGRIAGLLVHSTPPLVKPGNDLHLHELFVLNQFRGSGVARAAARALFTSHPGHYGLSVLASNTRALAFWDRLLADDAVGVERVSQDGGLICYSFTTARRADA